MKEIDSALAAANKPPQRTSLTKANKLYTNNDSLESSFMNALVYDYKASLDNSAPIKKSKKIPGVEDREESEESSRHSLMKTLTLSKSSFSSMTSIKEKQSFIESTFSPEQERKSTGASKIFEKTLSFNASTINPTSSVDNQISSKKDTNQRGSKTAKTSFKNLTPIEQLELWGKTSYCLPRPRKIILSADYRRSVERLYKSARKTKEQSPTRFATVHDKLKLDEQHLFQLTQRLAKSILFLK